MPTLVLRPLGTQICIEIPLKFTSRFFHQKTEKCCQKLTLQGRSNRQKLVQPQFFYGVNSHTHSYSSFLLCSCFPGQPEAQKTSKIVVGSFKIERATLFHGSLGFPKKRPTMTAKRDPQTVNKLKNTHKVGTLIQLKNNIPKT